MKKNQLTSAILLPAFFLLFIISCKKESKDDMGEEIASTANNAPGIANASQSDLLKSVRRATSKFHSTNQAIMAGYEPDDHCVAVPGVGGMGYHWANPSQIDPVYDPLKPEVVLYATGPDGNLQLVAIEYIVLNNGQTAPTFGGQPFVVGGTPVPIPHWSLHVWLYENNPNGMFTPFNPNITCP